MLSDAWRESHFLFPDDQKLVCTKPLDVCEVAWMSRRLIRRRVKLTFSTTPRGSMEQEQLWTFAQHLPCAQHRAKFFTCSNSFNSQGNPMWGILTLSPSYRWRNWGIEMLKNLPKLTQVSGMWWYPRKYASRVHTPQHLNPQGPWDR